MGAVKECMGAVKECMVCGLGVYGILWYKLSTKPLVGVM